MRVALILFAGFLIFCSCGHKDKYAYVLKPNDTVQDASGRKTVILAPTDGTADMNQVKTGSTTPQQLVAFAQTTIGIPYKYASFNPEVGFDCSGFITYTFNHFGIAVPRTSADFTNVKHEVPLQSALPGDLILFTGTDTSTHTVGHMGIITAPFNAPLQFIHATSGKANGVTVSGLTPGYQERFVKVIRVFPQNEKSAN